MPAVDRLSALPDNVIYPILSFLPTKTSIATSILSRRWRFMWAHVPNLDFDIRHLNRDTNWSSIIERVMSNLRVDSINTFRLYAYLTDFSENRLYAMIITAARLNILNMDLHFHHYGPPDVYEARPVLPLSIFSCQTLVELSLTMCDYPPYRVDGEPFPSLKMLYIKLVYFQTDEAFLDLLSRCPVLEELTIDTINCRTLSSHTVKKLDLAFSEGDLGPFPDFKMRINAPAIEYLNLWEEVGTHVLFCTLTSLVEADIVFYYPYGVSGQLPQYLRSVLSFLDSLCKVQWLKLSINMLFTFDIRSIAEFDNCTRLELDADWRFLIKFLESAHNLEVLILHRGFSTPRIWEEPEKVPACFLSRLGKVRIDEFKSQEAEFCLASYFLKNALALEKMEIRTTVHEFDLESKYTALQRITRFKRRSRECGVLFY